MTKPRINIIVAIAPDNAIGINGDLLFHVSADLKRFKALTMGHPIIMGRKTFDSLPKGALPGRRNIVISRNPLFHAEGAETATSLDNAISLCDGLSDVFVIGGAQIYAGAVTTASRLYLTRFDRTEPSADCFFPDINPGEWQSIESSGWLADEKSGVSYMFETLERNNL